MKKITYFNMKLSTIIQKFKDKELIEGKEYEIIAIDTVNDQVVFRAFFEENELLIN